MAVTVLALVGGAPAEGAKQPRVTKVVIDPPGTAWEKDKEYGVTVTLTGDGDSGTSYTHGIIYAVDGGAKAYGKLLCPAVTCQGFTPLTIDADGIATTKQFKIKTNGAPLGTHLTITVLNAASNGASGDAEAVPIVVSGAVGPASSAPSAHTIVAAKPATVKSVKIQRGLDSKDHTDVVVSLDKPASGLESFAVKYEAYSKKNSAPAAWDDVLCSVGCSVVGANPDSVKSVAGATQVVFPIETVDLRGKGAFTLTVTVVSANGVGKNDTVPAEAVPISPPRHSPPHASRNQWDDEGRAIWAGKSR
jgi:hypothetical protein